MNKKYIPVFAIAPLSVCLLVGQATAEELLHPLKENNSRGSSPIIKSLKKDHAVIEIKFAKINKNALQKNKTTVALPIFGGNENYIYHRNDINKENSVNHNGYIVWTGDGNKNFAKTNDKQAVKRDLFSNATLVMKGDSLAGSYRIDGQLYQIWPLQNNEVAIAKIDESKTAAEDNHEVDHQSNAKAVVCEPPGHYSGDSGPHSTIRVAVVTTNQLRAAIKGSDIDALVELAFTEANQAAADSDVGIHFERAGILDADYNEYDAEDYSSIRKAMMQSSGSWLSQQLHTYRENHRADLAVLLAEKSGSGTGTNDAKKKDAFSVVSYRKATGNYTFAHEMGHNIGASHDLNQYPNGKPKRLPCYRHGYQHEGKHTADRWRTVMSYDCKTGSCPRINLFSNPRITYNGIPLGSREYQDNARRLNERRKEVAAFYP